MAPSTCPNCRSPITASDEICDNCGMVLSPSAAIAPTPAVATSAATGSPVCSHCKAPITPGDEICDNCGLDLQSVQLSPAAPASPETPSEQALCPHCRTPRTSDKKFCNRCGYSFTSLESKRPIEQSSTTASTPQPSETLSVGHVLNGKYRVTKKIGEGGMGAVFLAQDQLLKRNVVIKTLLSNADPDMITQSVQEREFLANIKQANIVSIYDFISDGSRSYIVMEHVAGHTLDEITQQQGRPFDVVEALHYILGILPAFVYLAKLNPPLVYCDFKPDNVMREILRDGTVIVKLIDLGTVIKYNPTPDPKQAIYGTHGYFARQAIKRPTPQTDLYSICRVLAYLVSQMDLSTPLFGMPPASQYKVFRDYPALYRLLVKGTHDDPAQRFQSAEELAEQLAGVVRLIEGGKPGVPITSRLFASESTTTTGALGLRAEAALDEQDPAVHLLRVGDSALRSSKHTAAINTYKQAVGVNPTSLDALLRLVEVYSEQGLFTLAQRELTTAQRIAPLHWKIAWYTGRLLEAQGDLRQAATYYQQVIDHLPGELPPRQALARVQAALGDDATAANLYQDVLKADPSNTGAILGVTRSLRKLRRYQEAVQILTQVSEAAARYNEAQFNLCEIYLKDIQPITAANLQAAAQAIQALAGRTDEARFYRARAEVYYAAWELLHQKKLPSTIDLAGIPTVTRSTLGVAIEENYIEYLKREPRPADRETIIRRKFHATPWRWL